ncbi:MAG: sirohydrochlorin cobaltochelatase [Desulfobulbus sp.]
MMRRLYTLLFCAVFTLFVSSSAWAGESPTPPGHGKQKDKTPALLLVTFGTSVPSAQKAFANIEKEVRKAYPQQEVRWAYTSSVIRAKLAKEGKMIDSPEMALARLMEDGYGRVAVQSLHMIAGQEFEDLARNAKQFRNMVDGFDRVIVGYPLLASDAALDRVLEIVATEFVPKERKADEAVVLMGHGTHHPMDAVYSALMWKAQQKDPNMFIGTVEGRPSFDEVKALLVKKGIKKAYLVPLMTVAGDHVVNDMAGDDSDSWKSQLTAAGIESVPVLKGLAESEAIVGLWLENLKVVMAHMQ